MSIYERSLDSIHEWQAEQGQTDATYMAEALTLIANEQRLANMIAWYHVIPESDRGRKLREQIEQELGL